MARTTFRLPVHRFDDLIGLDITAGLLDLTVEAVEGITEVTVELTGPADVVRGASAFEGQAWAIAIPTPESGMSGNVSNGTVVVGRNFGSIVQAGNITGGSVVMSGGSISINGQTVRGGQQIGEPVRAVARVPRSSALLADITTGSVVTRGRMSSVKVTGQGVDTHVEHADRVETNTASGDTTVERVENSVVVHTESGDIDVRSGGTVAMLRSTSGDIDFTAGTQDSRVTATTTSGDVTVVRSGYRVSSRTSSVSGDIREW